MNNSDKEFKDLLLDNRYESDIEEFEDNLDKYDTCFIWRVVDIWNAQDS